MKLMVELIAAAKTLEKELTGKRDNGESFHYILVLVEGLENHEYNVGATASVSDAELVANTLQGVVDEMKLGRGITILKNASVQ